MLLSRLWYFILATLLAAAIAAVLLGHEAQVRTAPQTAAEELARERAMVGLLLTLESQQRLAGIGAISADRRVRLALARPGRLTATTRRGDTARANLDSALETLNDELGEMSGDIVFVVNAQGRIVSQLGGQAADRPAKAGLGRFPLVAAALRGFLRNDFWVYNDTVYTMVARPVIHSGRIIGAIAQGREIDRAFTRIVARNLRGNTALVFYRGELILGAAGLGEEGEATPASPRLTADAITTALAARTSPETEPAEDGIVPVANGRGLAFFSPVQGAARHVGVGWAVANPVPVTPGPFALIHQAPEEDVAALPTRGLGGAALFLACIGLLFVWWERDRPMRAFGRAVRALPFEDFGRLEASQLARRFRLFAQNINDGLDLAAEQGVDPNRPQGTTVDEALGEGKAPLYFGFVEIDNRSSTAGLPRFADPADDRAQSNGEDQIMSLEEVSTVSPEDIVDWEEDNPPMSRPRTPSPTGLKSEGKSEHAASTSDSTPALQEETNEGATAVTPRPPMLTLVTHEGEDEDPMAAHFRETYESYLAARQNCDESIRGITYARFCRTLMKNRDRILKDYPEDDVKFTVLMKNGRASLKAKRNIERPG